MKTSEGNNQFRTQEKETVQVYSIILPEAGKPHKYRETQRVPLEIRVKEFIDHEATIRDTITTVTGRGT